MSDANVLRHVAQVMRRSTVGDSAGAPKYINLQKAILAAIERGLWRASEKLPSETAFAEAVPVSLGTVQRALQKLADEGIIVRRHRHGTFVAGVLSPEEEIHHFRFLADDGESLLPVYSKILDVKLVDGRGPWAEFLGQGAEFVRLRRVLNVNFEFNTYSEYVLEADRFRTFLEIPLRELDGVALTHMLGVRFDAPTIRAVRRFRVQTIPSEACRTIGLPEKTVGMEWEVLGYTFRDAPLFYQRVFVPPNARKLEIRDRR